MSKPQTFEEWITCVPSANNIEVAIARIAWIDAHNNAARICESDDCKDLTGLDCAEKIRSRRSGICGSGRR